MVLKQHSLFSYGEASTISTLGLGRGVGGFPGYSLPDPSSWSGGPDLKPNGSGVNYGGSYQLMQFTGLDLRQYLNLQMLQILYILKGSLPAAQKENYSYSLTSSLDIFRPFVGYRGVRLVSKESKHRGRDPLILCFVDFENPACAATAMIALKGYKVHEFYSQSSHLRLQFSRYPGPRSRLGSRGKR
ncbi:unnamed protein product [Lupinus luteus]|uniref:RRM domain-containing protein n=1 Tax=Lupinus luteus TaxID=3873 RepID=A0AAV1YGZ7_LUPLU